MPDFLDGRLIIESENNLGGRTKNAGPCSRLLARFHQFSVEPGIVERVSWPYSCLLTP